MAKASYNQLKLLRRDAIATRHSLAQAIKALEPGQQRRPAATINFYQALLSSFAQEHPLGLLFFGIALGGAASLVLKGNFKNAGKYWAILKEELINLSRGLFEKKASDAAEQVVNLLFTAAAT